MLEVVGLALFGGCRCGQAPGRDARPGILGPTQADPGAATSSDSAISTTNAWARLARPGATDLMIVIPMVVAATQTTATAIAVERGAARVMDAGDDRSEADRSDSRITGLPSEDSE